MKSAYIMLSIIAILSFVVVAESEAYLDIPPVSSWSNIIIGNTTLNAPLTGSSLNLTSSNGIVITANQTNNSLNFAGNEQSIQFSFLTENGKSGDFWFAGNYQNAASDNNFNPSINFGLTNSSSGGHFYVVTGQVPGSDITIEVSGRTIFDNGTTVSNDSEIITVPSGTPIDSYFETDKKFMGQVTVETTSASNIDCNYGYAKYYDSQNSDFTITGIEVFWIANANDSDGNFKLIRHSSNNWTFVNNGEAINNDIIADMNVDQGDAGGFRNDGYGQWKRDNLNAFVNGSISEGIIFNMFTNTNSAMSIGNAIIYYEEN